MAYNTVPIKKDLDGKPIPQYYNEVQGVYEAAEGSGGLQKVLLCNSDGSPIEVDSINESNLGGFNKVINKLDDLIEVLENVT